jgi:hypothetical protein
VVAEAAPLAGCCWLEWAAPQPQGPADQCSSGDNSWTARQLANPGAAGPQADENQVLQAGLAALAAAEAVGAVAAANPQRPVKRVRAAAAAFKWEDIQAPSFVYVGVALRCAKAAEPEA